MADNAGRLWSKSIDRIDDGKDSVGEAKEKETEDVR